MKKARVGLSIAAAATMLVAVVGCGTGASNGGGANSAGNTQSGKSGSSQDVTLTWFMWSGSQAEVSMWKKLAANVTVKYPNIHVKFETASWPDYWSKLQTEAASGTTPDIISLQSLRTLGFGSAFQSLDSYIQNDPSINVSDFNSSIMKGLQYNGHQVALPYDFGPEVIFYNKTLFEKYHVPLPKAGWTWADFENDVKKLSQGNDYGFVNNATPDNWLPFALSNGASYLTSDGKYNFNNPQIQQTIQQLSDLVKNHEAPQMVATSDSNWPFEQWESGHVGMVVDGPWDIINYNNTVKFQFGVAPIPVGTKGSVTVVAGSGFGISKTTKYPDAVFKAISVLTGQKSETELGQAGRAYPARDSARASYYHGSTANFQPALDYAVQHSIPYTITTTWQQANDMMTKALLPIYNGQTPVSQGLQGLQQQLSSLQ